MANNFFDPKDPRTWPKKTLRAMEAFTNVGEAATGLARSQADNRFASNAQTPVQNAGGNFNLRGMQTPYENFDISPGNVAESALTAISFPVAGGMASSPTARAASYIGGKLGNMSAAAQFAASTAKGFEASGAGGKIKNVMTPMGPSIASTAIGSTAQQAARMGNLTTMKAKEAISGGTIFANQLARTMMQAGRAGKTLSNIGLVGKNIYDIFDN